MSLDNLIRDGDLPAITSSNSLQISQGASPAMLAAPGGGNSPLNLESGAVWANTKTGVTLKYMFWNSLPTYYSGSDAEANNFQAFSASMKAATVDVLTQISTFANINFVETTTQLEAQLGYAQARIDPNAGAWAYYPSGHPKGGDVWTNNLYSNTQNVTKGSYGYYVLLHETGHALGLEHTFDAGLTGAYNTEQYSVMAYDWTPWGSVFAQSYMLFDIAALQDMYGANMTYHTGNDTYALVNRAAYTIWDAGGTDTLDASAVASSVTLRLEAGTFSSVGLTDNIAIAYNVTIENANGGESGDTIYGNSVANVLNGNGGDDTFYTDAGNDTINGGNGTDTVVYSTSLSNFLVNFINSVTVTIQDLVGSLGTDTLTYIERFIFGGTSYDRTSLETAVGYSGGGPSLSVMNVAFSWSGGSAKITSVTETSSTLTAASMKYSRTTGDIISTSRTGNELSIDFLQNVTISSLKYDGGNDNETLILNGTASVTTKLTGGAGDDTFTIASSLSGNDTVSGGDGNDTVHAGAGNDKINGDSGNDVLYGDDGSDKIYGDDGNDTLHGGLGSDYLYGGNGNDTINGDDGDDRLYGEAGDDTINGGNGNDTITGADGNDTIGGGAGIDNIKGDAGNDTLYGNDGDDKIYGGDGWDILYGGNGADSLYGANGNDTLNGDDGDDRLYGESNNDTLNGGNGADYISGGDGNDTLNGDDGDDRLYGESGNDTVSGGNGNDYINGGDGNDILAGGAGNDKIYGGGSNDKLTGGGGADALYGDAGSDVFAFTVLDGNVSTIADFRLTGAEKDYINITDILSGFDKNTDNIYDFVRFSLSRSKIDITINADGTGSDWIALATVKGSTFTGVTVSGLLASGQLVTDEHF